MSLYIQLNQLREDSDTTSLESGMSRSGARETTQLVYFYHDGVKVLVKVKRINTVQA